MASVTVDWGDGSTHTFSGLANINGSTQNATVSGHQYADAGTYTITVTWNQAPYAPSATTTVTVLGAYPLGLTARELRSDYAFD